MRYTDLLFWGEMKILAEKIAEHIDIPQIRVDFYEAKGKVYFGEVTFFHVEGMSKFYPSEWDYKFWGNDKASEGVV